MIGLRVDTEGGSYVGERRIDRELARLDKANLM